MDADLTAVPLYEQYGFKKVTRSLRFLGKITARSSALVKRATQNDINKMCEIDTKLFGDDRSYFLRRRHNLFPHLCLVLKIENSIGGYIFGRPGINAISVVPLAVLLDTINPLELLQTLAVEEPTYSLSIGVL